MNRRHAAVISAFLALALVAGLFSALRTTRLGASAAAPAVSAARIAQRNRQLDAVVAQLTRQARQKPPALPALPVARTAPAQAAAAAPQRVVYVRPAPIVHVIHRHHESEHERGDGGGLDD